MGPALGCCFWRGACSTAWPNAFWGVTSYFWYYAPLLPGAVAITGLKPGDRRRAAVAGEPVSVRAGLAPAVLAALLALAQVGALGPDAPAPRPAGGRVPGGRPVADRQHAARFHRGQPGGRRYRLPFAHRPTIDFAGLIQPEAASRPETDHL